MKIPAFNNLRLIHIGLVKKPAFLFDGSLILRMSHFSKREVELDEQGERERERDKESNRERDRERE